MVRTNPEPTDSSKHTELSVRRSHVLSQRLRVGPAGAVDGLTPAMIHLDRNCVRKKGHGYGSVRNYTSELSGVSAALHTVRLEYDPN